MALRDVVLADSPYYYYELEQLTGQFLDSSGNNRHATVQGIGPVRDQEGIVAKGVKGRGAAPNSDGFELVGFNAAVINNWTLMVWVVPNENIVVYSEATSGYTGNVGNQRYVAYPTQAGPSNGGAGLSVGLNAIQVIEHGDNYIPTLLSYTLPTALSAQRYTCLHIVCQAKQYRLYIDGILVRTGLTSVRANSVAPHWWLADGWSNGYSGRIDEVALFPTVLSQARITAHSSSFPIPRPLAPVTNTLVRHHSGVPVTASKFTLEEFMTGRTPRDPWPDKVSVYVRPSYWNTKPSRTKFPEAP